jgi:hypothetical protein
MNNEYISMGNNGIDRELHQSMALRYSEDQLSKEKTKSAWLDYILSQIMFTLKDAKALGLLERKPEVFDMPKFIEWKTNCFDQETKKIAEEHRLKIEAERAEARRVIHGMTKSQKEALMTELKAQSEA